MTSFKDQILHSSQVRISPSNEWVHHLKKCNSGAIQSEKHASFLIV